MSDQISTAAELDALPVGSVVARICSDGQGSVAYALTSDGWLMSTERITTPRVGEYDQVGNHIGPLTVLYRPDAPARTEPTEEQVAIRFFEWDTEEHPDPRPTWSGLSEAQRDVWRSGARAVLALLPQRVAPSAEDLLPELDGRFGLTHTQAILLAESIAATVYTTAPTVAEVKAEAWDEGYTRGFYDRERLSPDIEGRDASEGATANLYRQEDAMPDFDVPKVRDAAAREMDANFNPDKHPILAAMFSDYSQTAMSVIVPAVTQQIRALAERWRDDSRDPWNTPFEAAALRVCGYQLLELADMLDAAVRGEES